MKLSPRTDFIYSIMRDWGCPAHSEMFYKVAVEKYDYPYRYDTFRRSINRMAKAGKIRVLRPAVFSAYSEARD